MSPQPDDLSALPLDELQIAPEWVRSGARSYEEHSGEDREGKRDRRHRPPRERRPTADAPRDRRPEDRRSGERSSPRPPRGRDHRGPPPGAEPTTPKPQPPAVADLEVDFLPEEKGVGAMMETMKQSRRAYALFDIAKLLLNKPERHLVSLARKAGADGLREPLLLVGGEQPCLSREEAVRLVFRRMKDKAFKETRKPVDPPKGNFTFVNRCGITGEWLGPPNYHEYQARLVRHHQQRLRHLPFEEFRARIQTVRDPEAVQAWIASKSFVMEYECLLDAPPQVFSSRRELEKHIVEHHLAELVTSPPEVVLSGPGSRQIEHSAILEAVRLAWLGERRFPLRTANHLSERLRKEGFHFFKHNKGITYISYIKPRRFEATEGLGEQVQKLVMILRANRDCTRKKLLEHFAPVPAPGDAAAEKAEAAPVQPVASPEEERLLADLHWLIQDGYVVEFSDGRLWALEAKPSKPPSAPSAEPPAAGGAVDAPPGQETPQGQPATEPAPTDVAVPAAAPGGEGRDPAGPPSETPIQSLSVADPAPTTASPSPPQGAA